MTPARHGGPGADPLPTFIVIGAMKAGTTSLYHYMEAHRDISMPRVKELDFFVEEMNWGRGVDWYRQQFAGAVASARGEVSTAYTKFPRYRGVSARMADLVPEVRLVYVVRDPIERIRSHYQHRVANGSETRAAEDALFDDPVYLDYSRYAFQIDQYMAHFDPSKLLVVTAEDLRDERTRTLRCVFDFVGVDPDFVPPNVRVEFYRTAERRHYPTIVWRGRRLVKRWFPQAKRAKELVDSAHLRRGKRDTEARPGSNGGAWLDPQVRARLADELASDVARLRRHMGPHFDGWGLA